MWQPASMHISRALRLKQLNGVSVMIIYTCFPTVTCQKCFLWEKMICCSNQVLMKQTDDQMLLFFFFRPQLQGNSSVNYFFTWSNVTVLFFFTWNHFVFVFSSVLNHVKEGNDIISIKILWQCEITWWCCQATVNQTWLICTHSVPVKQIGCGFVSYLLKIIP